MKSSDVRQGFIDYFKKNGHAHVPSSSLIPHDDPTLLFTNAGMNQFKNVFLGLEQRDYKRAVTSQKCVRAGGKHNDLENVGFTARHHTFFEMLGNFSFGDYFKKDAIHFAWELLTKDLGIPKDKLYVTVFRTDDEAADIWHKQEGVPRDRIFRFDEKDNFWRMGDVGPCGPCSEIFYDHGPLAGKESDPFKGIAAGEDRFVEIWNLVFMQYEEKAPGVLEPLPKPSVDTGGGLERMVAALQGRFNNYNTDLFTTIIQTATSRLGWDLEEMIQGEISLKKDPNLSKVMGRPTKQFIEDLAALRVLADHARSTSFLIADGALPSNEGRGYVLRRILRRAIRYGRKLSEQHSFLPLMSEALIKQMSSVYPELNTRHDHILSTIKDEETRFLQTLDQGTGILNDELAKAKSKGAKGLSGEVVFKLYDTYGFPVDLTQLMAQEEGVSVDLESFESHMEGARAKSKASWKGKGLQSDEKHLISFAQTSFDQNGTTSFKGYDSLSGDGKVVALSDGT
ncbi:MAG TPA: alanine--tRNA ligase, partial [Pseudobdellovibrionaceae bacterium]|nr:alanine--tRNA ligase [Pseudobdellovibrionaceae bacterium]